MSRNPETKTGDEWYTEETWDFVIQDISKGWPPGTWNSETITKEEFLSRILKCSIVSKS